MQFRSLGWWHCMATCLGSVQTDEHTVHLHIGLRSLQFLLVVRFIVLPRNTIPVKSLLLLLLRAGSIDTLLENEMHSCIYSKPNRRDNVLTNSMVTVDHGHYGMPKYSSSSASCCIACIICTISPNDNRVRASSDQHVSINSRARGPQHGGMAGLREPVKCASPHTPPPP